MDRNISAELVVFCVIAVIALAGLLFFVYCSKTGNAVQPFCSDTDNGLEYYTKGTVFYEGGNKTDTCLSSRMMPLPTGEGMWEYYCKNGKMTWVYYRCPYFCTDGACRVKR